MRKNIFIIFLLLSFLSSTSCQNVKDALSGAKQNQSDEFLVKKKNPLVLPPNYDKLPKPGDSVKNLADENYQDNVKDLLKVVENEETKKSSSENQSIEEFVIKNINKN